jgi:hypothetical protein
MFVIGSPLEHNVNRTRTRPNHLRSALTLRDVIVVVGTFILLLFLYSISRPSMDSRPRSRCASNLKNIGTAFHTYANDNSDMWPNCTLATTAGPGSPLIIYAPGLIGKDRELSDDALAARSSDGRLRMSPTRNLWALIRLQILSPDSMICPSSDAWPNNEPRPEQYWDFQSYSELSYGYQIPFGKVGQPSSNCDPRMPLAADRGPYGAAIEAGKPHPGPPTADLSDPPDNWRLWNSPNHADEGENVLFADAHVEWTSKPIVGIQHDNIYTRWRTPEGSLSPSGSDPLSRAHGLPPTGSETPMSNTDTLIYP